MWYWIKVILTGGWYHYHCSLKKAAELIDKMISLKQKQQYVTIEKFELGSDEYVSSLVKILDSPAWRFFVFDLKSTITGLIEEDPVEMGTGYIGILKGVRYLENKLQERVSGTV